MKNQLNRLLGEGRIKEKIDLFPYLSMKLHVIAEYYFEAKSKEDILNAVNAAHTVKLPLVMLGGGSNIIFGHSLVEGLVVKNSFSSITEISKTDETVDIEVGSGTYMAFLIQQLTDKGLSGLEYHKGLPGTVGGAIYMNSKWMHPLVFVGDCVVSALLIDNQGREKKVDKNYFAFDYGYSVLQKTKEYLVSVVFRLKKNTCEEVMQRSDESLIYRKKTQPIGVATCGCFFKNISDDEQKLHTLPTKSAGYLIDKAGMKGTQIGSFGVSEMHVNFIVNYGGDARLEDLIKLVRLIKEQVKKKFGVELREEVQIV